MRLVQTVPAALIALSFAARALAAAPAPPPLVQTPAAAADVTVDALAAPGFDVPGLNPRALAFARQGYACAVKRGLTTSPILTIIDYSLPSSEQRLWVVDVAHDRVLFHELVAHGKNSGGDVATRFSNTPQSLQTSLGWYRTAATYVGRHGRSLRLDGLEPGMNDNARDRAIVVHGADYVNEAFVRKYGRLGRSWGCPALANDVAQPVIDAIRDGSMLLAWYPDEDWLAGSSFNCE